ncbi:Uncharacterised protein [Capnocytophaga ochracea]|uniref:Restriction endonuclease type IV Mrr domain-containing protein n=1 Tax=Capnocytophaga ochracea TaxID=1018 RepID=A0A2X2TQZ3_CAPOC|nr:restriction endonuclease [Capnocytophaga ochracea]SQA78950.1 Uncharacterised protein [Capnocytophaga ochracea]
MIYKKEDIRFEKINPTEFENLCYDLLVKYNFSNIIWRQGSADNGRDLEATIVFNNSIRDKELKYFFECKHFNSGGVPPEKLISKISWADAEKPDFLILILSSYLTNNARDWLDKIASDKKYDIICIEGEELKERLLKYPDLIERYFSFEHYKKMFKDMKEYQFKYDVKLSFSILESIINNIPLSKFDNEDLAFILLNFYIECISINRENDKEADFYCPNIINKVLEHMKSSIENDTMIFSQKYYDNYDILGGYGFVDEMEELELKPCKSNRKELNFQYYILYLNYSQNEKNWKLGHYLFIVYDNVAFEMFKDEKIEIRIIRNFTPDKIVSMEIKTNNNLLDNYKKYLAYFNDNDGSKF